MKWSKLKQKAEERLADSLKGRLQYHVTNYTRSDSTLMARAWITLDGVEIVNFSSAEWQRDRYRLSYEIRAAQVPSATSAPYSSVEYKNAGNEAEEILKTRGSFRRWDFTDALHRFLELSIEDALTHEYPLIRALAQVDRRTGKRRLRELQTTPDRHPIVQQFFAIRLDAENMLAD